MRRKLKKRSKLNITKSNTEKSVFLDRPKFNMRMEFTYGPPPLLGQTSPPKGEKGIYQILYVLCIPGKDIFRDELNIREIMQSGDSLIYIGREEISVKILNDSGGVEVIVKNNKVGNASIIGLRVNAENFIDAEKRAYNFVMPMLSYWSFYHDVAIDFTGYEVLEEITGIKKWSFGVVGDVKHFANCEFETKNEFRPVLASYREAMNSTNIFYQVLSFYKVLEGLKTLRSLRHKKLHDEGKTPTDPEQKFPNCIDDLKDIDPWTKEELRKYEGKKYSWVLDQYRELIRNAIAHLNPTENILEADKYDDVMTCERGLLVLKYLAREILNNELNEYKKL